MDPIRLGAILDGSFEIDGGLGEGAMGVVFSARHRGMGKRVTSETMRPGIAWNQALAARFEQAARAASAIGYLAGKRLADPLFRRPAQPPRRCATATLATPLYMSPGQVRALPVGRSLLKGENYAVVR